LLVAVYFLPSFLVVAIGKGQLQNRHPKARHIIILFWKYLVDIRSEAWLNLFWEYIN
jgi:hypothetical protein